MCHKHRHKISQEEKTCKTLNISHIQMQSGMTNYAMLQMHFGNGKYESFLNMLHQKVFINMTKSWNHSHWIRWITEGYLLVKSFYIVNVAVLFLT